MILLTSNTKAQFSVDEDDYPKILQHNHIFTENHKGGIQLFSKVLGRTIVLARLILNIPLDDGKNVDHIDGNKKNNTKNNLRIASLSQNQWNRKKNTNSTSRFKGVHWSKADKRWKASIRVNSKPYHLGLFNVEQEAAEAYNKAALKHFGEFAYINTLS